MAELMIDARTDRVLEIARRLLMVRVFDPTWTLNRAEFDSAMDDAFDMAALGVPDDVLDQIAPRPVKADG